MRKSIAILMGVAIFSTGAIMAQRKKAVKKAVPKVPKKVEVPKVEAPKVEAPKAPDLSNMAGNLSKKESAAPGMGLDLALRVGLRPDLFGLGQDVGTMDSDEQTSSDATNAGTTNKISYTAFGAGRGLVLGLDARYTLPFMPALFVGTGFEYSMQIGMSSNSKLNTTISTSATTGQDLTIKTTHMMIPFLLGVQKNIDWVKVYAAAGGVFATGSFELGISDKGTTAQYGTDKEGTGKFSGSGLGVRGALGMQVPVTNAIALGFEFTADHAVVNTSADGANSAETDKTADNTALQYGAYILNGLSMRHTPATATTALKANAPLNFGGWAYSFRVVYSL